MAATGCMRHVIVPVIDAAPTPPALGAVVHSLQGQTMGTTWCIKLVAPERQPINAIHAAITQQLDEVIAQMSTWEPDSDLSRFNRAAPGTWFALPEACYTVLDCALAVARESGGAYDPSAGRLVNLWGFGPGLESTLRYDQPGFAPPSAADIAAARTDCDWQRVELDPATQRVRQPGGVMLDFSAIAKGYAVDRVAHVLRAHGVNNFLVEVGGELRGEGVGLDGQPWWVAIEQPADAVTLQNEYLGEYLVALYGLSIATSGDYRRYFLHDGVRRPHTIDPRTGWPISHPLASVSVLHADCMLADAWSTALGVMGVDAGLTCADRLGLAALFITRENNGLRAAPSRALEDLLQ